MKKPTDDKNLNSYSILKVELSNEDAKKLKFLPLIEITVMLNNTLEAKGLYDWFTNNINKFKISSSDEYEAKLLL